MTFEEIQRRFKAHRCSYFSAEVPNPDPECPECQWLRKAFRSFAPDPNTFHIEDIRQQLAAIEGYKHTCRAGNGFCLLCLGGRWVKDGL